VTRRRSTRSSRARTAAGPVGPVLAVAVLAVTLLAGSPASSQEPTPGEPPGDAPAEEPAPIDPSAVALHLAGLTPVATPGTSAEVRLRLEGVPGQAFVQVVLRQRVRSRTEFERSVEGAGLRGAVIDQRHRVDTLPVNPADGSRVVSLLLDPAVPGGFNLSAPGAYPLQVRLLTPDNDVLAELVTHLVVGARPGDPAPALAVGLSAELGAPPAIAPDGTVAVPTRELEALARLAGALAAVPDVPVTLDVVPETLDALAGLDDETAAAALGSLGDAAQGRTVLARPYVDVSVEALAGAGLLDELDAQLDHGRTLLAGALGTEPAVAPLVAPPDLGPAGAAALVARGHRRFVFDPDHLSSAPTGGLTMAHRFQVDLSVPDRNGDADQDGTGRQGSRRRVVGLQADTALEDRLRDQGDVALVAQRIVAELAVIQTEQPAISRAVVIRVGDRARPEVVAALLGALRAGGGLLEVVELDEAFERATDLTDPVGSDVRRTLDPEDPPTLGPSSRFRDARALLAGYRSVVGAESPRTEPLLTHVLVAAARDLDSTERSAHLDAVAAEVRALVDAVALPERPQVTLTARSATIPLTLANDTGFPVEVVVHLDSSRLEFPAGESLPLTLDAGSTRTDLAVRTLSSGAFPLEVVVRSPDGSIELASTRYTVRSTAVSGVGLVLSAGAGLFLVAWWASHWHRTRRSRRLIPLE
jgi:hypothetical protein